MSHTTSILVTTKPPGRPGGTPGLLLIEVTEGTIIPEGCKVFRNGKVFIDEGVTTEMLKRKTGVKNVHLLHYINSLP